MSGGGGGSDGVEQSWGEKEMAAVAADKWNRYQTDFKKMEDIFIGKSQMRDIDFKQASGYANVDTNAAFGSKPIVQAGSGGNLATKIDAGYKDKAIATSTNLVASGNQTEDRHTAGLNQIIAAGNGQQIDAHNNLSRNSSLNFQQAVGDANRSSQKYVNRQSNIGTAAGLATYGVQTHARAGSAPQAKPASTSVGGGNELR